MSKKGFSVVAADSVEDFYNDQDVPGEFRNLTEALGAQQLAVTLIRVPPHSDFEQGTGHYHENTEEIYIITKGILTMRFDDTILEVPEGSAARVSPKTKRSHRNEGDAVVEIWAISQKDGHDAAKISDFWEASDKAMQN